ncbi:hypothetical protein ACFL2E_03010 [Thermodesulfobacteriota bacterium]
MWDKDANKIQWYINFVNLNIGELTSGNRIKWINETLNMIEYGDFDIDSEMRRGADNNVSIIDKISQWQDSSHLEKCHATFKKYFDKLIGNVEKLSEKGEGQSSEGKTNRTSIIEMLDSKITVNLIYMDDIHQDTFNVTFRSAEDSMSIMLAFLQELNGVLIESFKKCPECSNWFLQISKKNKIYCSNKCAARKVARNRRAKLKADNPSKYEAELKKNAERAKKAAMLKKQKEQGQKLIRSLDF